MKTLLHTSFFRFRKKSFFWRQPHFCPTLEVPPKCTCSLIRPWWFSLNGITALLINNFLFWSSPHFSHLNLPTTIPQNCICNFNWSWQTFLHVLFHFKKNPCFWWPPHFSHIIIPLQEYQKRKGNFLKKTGKPSWTAFF